VARLRLAPQPKAADVRLGTETDVALTFFFFLLQWGA
jgi:hypothetical protein